MTAIVLGMLFCVGLAACVLALVVIPARRQGKVLLTERGEDVVASVRERSGAVTSRASGAVDRVRSRRADRSGDDADEYDDVEYDDAEYVDSEYEDDDDAEESVADEMADLRSDASRAAAQDIADEDLPTRASRRGH